MGTFAYMYKASRNIELPDDEINPNEQEHLNTLTQTITTQEMHPQLPERDIYKLIESHPLHPIYHRPLTRYSAAQRESRRAVSERIRASMAECMLQILQQDNIYKTERYYSALLNRNWLENDPHNEEVARLFAKRTDEEEKEFRRLRVLTRVSKGEKRVAAELAVEEEMNVEYPRRRAEFIIRRVDECVLRYRRNIAPFMTDGVNINVITDKYGAAVEITSVILEIDNFLKISNADEKTAYISFTDEEKQKLREIKDTYQPLVTIMRETFSSIANPCYEFINPEELAGYDCTEIFDEYRETMQENYLSPIDSFSLMLEDRLGAEQGRDMILRDNLEKIKQSYNMQGDISIRAEQYSGLKPLLGNKAVLQLNAGHPIAISNGDGIIVVSRTGNPDSGELTVNTPMEYFNHYFGVKKIEITEQLIDADPFYIRSSPEFRAMRRTLEKVVLLPALPEDASVETKQRYLQLFETLAQQADAYYQKKTSSVNDLDDLNKLEMKRVELATNVKYFASMKAEHLGIVNSALSTMLRHEQQLAEEEKKVDGPEVLEQQNLEQEAHENIINKEPDPHVLLSLEYLNEKTTQYAAAVPALANALSKVYDGISSSCVEMDGEIEPYEVTHEKVADLAGAMVAAVLVSEEKKALEGTGVQGVRETLLCGENGDKVRAALGHDVIFSLFGHELGVEYNDDTKDFMQTFDPAKAAADIKETFEKKFGVSFVEKLAANYRDTIKPMRGAELDGAERTFLDWTCKNILEPGCAYCAHFAGNEENVDFLAANKVLASCVMHNMVQLERASLGGQAPGSLETMLADPEAAAKLQERVMTSPEFEKMTGELGLSDIDAMVKADILPKAIENQMPRKAAESIFKAVLAEQAPAERKSVAPQAQKQMQAAK